MKTDNYLKRTLKKYHLTQIYANPTQINADLSLEASATICVKSARICVLEGFFSNPLKRGIVFSLIFIIAAGLGVWGCGRKGKDAAMAIAGAKAAKGAKGTLTVFVPCSIFAPFCEILDAYKKEHRGVKVNFDTGNSIILMRKIVEKGARPDVYIATGPKEMSPLAEKGLIDQQKPPIPLTFDSLILVTPRGNPKNIQSASDLTREDIKSIAIPEPVANSSGVFAEEYFKQTGLWPEIKDKVTFTEFGRNARNYIIQNKVDAAILYRSCLYEDLKAYDKIVAPKDIHVVADLFKDGRRSIPTPIVVLPTSQNKELAEDFMNYMLSPKSQQTLRKWEVIEVAGK